MPPKLISCYTCQVRGEVCVGYDSGVCGSCFLKCCGACVSQTSNATPEAETGTTCLVDASSSSRANDETKQGRKRKNSEEALPSTSKQGPRMNLRPVAKGSRAKKWAKKAGQREKTLNSTSSNRATTSNVDTPPSNSDSRSDHTHDAEHLHEGPYQLRAEIRRNRREKAHNSASDNRDDVEHLLEASYGFFRDIRDRLLRVCSDKLLRDKACALVGANAAQFGDLIHHYLADVSSQDMLCFLQDICSRSGELPSSLWLKDVKVHREDYIARGGEACIYHGTLDNRKVVVREISKPGSADWTSREGKHVIELTRREILLHAQIRHQNVIPLLGIWNDSRGPPLMVMPLAENGSALAYLQGKNRDASHCAKILTGSALGLSHLHSRLPIIIHGDMHPTNIVIDREGNALISDLGFSRIRHDITRSQSKIREGGRYRFLAPELLDGAEEFRTTASSDIYSTSLTFWCLVTLKTPFSQYPRDYAAASAAKRGERPEKTYNPRFLTLDRFRSLWKLFECMWAPNPSDRPDAGRVADRLQEIFNGNMQ